MCCGGTCKGFYFKKQKCSHPMGNKGQGYCMNISKFDFNRLSDMVNSLKDFLCYLEGTAAYERDFYNNKFKVVSNKNIENNSSLNNKTNDNEFKIASVNTNIK